MATTVSVGLWVLPPAKVRHSVLTGLRTWHSLAFLYFPVAYELSFAISGAFLCFASFGKVPLTPLHFHYVFSVWEMSVSDYTFSFFPFLPFIFSLYQNLLLFYKHIWGSVAMFVCILLCL